MQIWGGDPGAFDVYSATRQPNFTTAEDYKATSVSFSAKWYYQAGYITTSNAKIKRWQEKDPVYQNILKNAPRSAKTSDAHKLKVSG